MAVSTNLATNPVIAHCKSVFFNCRPAFKNANKVSSLSLSYPAILNRRPEFKISNVAGFILVLLLRKKRIKFSFEIYDSRQSSEALSGF